MIVHLLKLQFQYNMMIFLASCDDRIQNEIDYEKDFHGATLEVFKPLILLVLDTGMFDLCPKCLEFALRSNS